jgi:hypothetical protein
MRRQTSTVIASSVLLAAAVCVGSVQAVDDAGSAAQAAAKPKLGGPCKQAGKVTMIKGVRAKCTPRGGPGKTRLVWVKVRGNPTPSPSPTPVPTPTPTPTPTPGPSPSRERPIALSGLYSTAWTWAHKDVDGRLAAVTLASVPLDVRRTDNFPADLAQRMLAGYDRIGSFWSDVTSPQQPIIVRMGTEKDLNWWRNEVGRFGPMYDAIASMYASAGAYANSANSYSEGSQFHHQFTFGTLMPLEGQRHAIHVTVPHEFTHSIQAAAGGGLNSLPCWFVEGHANFYGVAVGAPDEAERSAERQRTLRRELPISGAWPATLPDQVAQAIRQAESRDGYMCPRSSYSLGMLAVEALVTVYGHVEVNRFMTQSKAMAWTSAFTSTFGTTPEEFYSAVAPYIVTTSTEAMTR